MYQGLEMRLHRLKPFPSFLSSCGKTCQGGWTEIRYIYKIISVVCKKAKKKTYLGVLMMQSRLKHLPSFLPSCGVICHGG